MIGGSTYAVVRPQPLISDVLGLWHWRAWVIGIGVLTVLFYGIQLWLQSKEDKRRDETLDQILAEIKGSKAPSSISVEPTHETQNLPQQATDIGGELHRIFLFPKLAVDYRVYKELWQLKGNVGNPTIDCDVLVKLYVVNKSQGTKWIRTANGSVVVGAIRKQMDLQPDFTVQNVFGGSVEYGWEDKPNSAEWPKPLERLFSKFPYELNPQAPAEGWIRFLLKDADPESIDPNSWMFNVVDSLGDEHPITQTATMMKEGGIGLRRVSG